MSSKGRKKKEDNSAEYYPTPGWCVHRFIETVNLPNGSWLEPCAGNGDIIHAVKEKKKSITWHANELREDCKNPLERISDRVTISDYLKWDVPGPKPYDVIITNPPFSLAMDVITKSLALADNVAMLLRLNFIGTAERTPFFRECMPDIYVIPERPSFDGKGADSIEYAWFVWGGDKSRMKSVGSIRILPNTSLSERKATKPLDIRVTDQMSLL